MDAQLEKDEKKIIKISVRNLVEFILREGDIDNRHGELRPRKPCGRAPYP